MKKNLKNMQSPTVFKRRDVNRDTRKSVRGETATRTIGPLYPGCEIFGFTKGQFSIIDIIEHCLLEAGPSKVTICTWSAADGDIRAANRLLSNHAITDLKFVIDHSFKARKPVLCQALIDTFGYDCIRVTSIHAKFTTIKSDKYSLVIRTSMNLNYNPRFENFEISDDPKMYAFLSQIIDEIWTTQDLAEGFEKPRYDTIQQFKKMYTSDGLERVSLDDITPGKL